MNAVTSVLYNPRLVKMSGLRKDELLAAFGRAEIWSYQFVAQAQTVTDETYKSGGSEESDDEVGDVNGSRITRGARLERTGNMLPYRPTNYSHIL